MWRDSGTLSFNAPTSQNGYWHIIRRGFLVNILNPKLSIFFLAFLPLFVSPGTVSPVLDMVLLSAVFMAMTLFIFVLYGIAANGVRRYVVTSPKLMRWVQRSFATLFAVIGIKLAMTNQ
jgi:threonine/homoserine/homoserine lactone efflux protein